MTGTTLKTAPTLLCLCPIRLVARMTVFHTVEEGSKPSWGIRRMLEWITSINGKSTVCKTVTAGSNPAVTTSVLNLSPIQFD